MRDNIVFRLFSLLEFMSLHDLFTLYNTVTLCMCVVLNIWHILLYSQRVCYKTVIDRCAGQYRVYINRRNFSGLKHKCRNETEQLAEVDEGEIIFSSPRYKCEKKSGKFYDYRQSELCLYNISIANCESGRAVIEVAERDDVELEHRSNGTCNDYLQFYYYNHHSTLLRTNRTCGRELYNLPILPATQFLAVFWTDRNYISNVGFSFKVKCQPSVSDEDLILGSGYNESLHP